MAASFPEEGDGKTTQGVWQSIEPDVAVVPVVQLQMQTQRKRDTLVL